MHLFFDFMVWPRTPWPTLYMRIRRVVLRAVDVFFVAGLGWPRTRTERIVKNWGFWVEGFDTLTRVCKNKSRVYSLSFLLLYCMYSMMLYKSGISSFDLSTYTVHRPAGAL